MKTYLSDIIPKIQKFSQKMDDLTLLTNQHWVVIDELQNSKNVYVFRSNNELLISQNGKVEKAKWEYLGNNSILIDRKEESYLFKHGFFDKNILALQVDGRSEYAFLVNENKFKGELNSPDKVVEFLSENYIQNVIYTTENENVGLNEEYWRIIEVETDKGIIEIKTKSDKGYTIDDPAYLNGEIAPDGRYVLGWPSWWNFIAIENGKIVQF
jgi:lipopolysaccharide export LptBFGC system permease protein LptF